MGSEEPAEPLAGGGPRLTHVPLGKSGRRLSFERRLRLWLYLLGLPTAVFCWLLLRQHSVEPLEQGFVLLALTLGWMFAISILVEQVIRPLQTLANVVAALREDDYSFRARGGQRNDALGDLALEVNRLASMLQGQRAGALEAMALVERVMGSMQSPVLAFDPEGRLRLLNAAGEEAFGLRIRTALGHSAIELKLERLLNVEDDEVITLGAGQHSARWVVKRTSFRLRGIPHTLLVLSDVSAALREEERIAWERLIRVLGHEINNSLTPIKSIAGSLRGRLAVSNEVSGDKSDFERGLEVIENRSESLNRFLQAYRQLMGLPAPKLKDVSLAALVERVADLERRVAVTVKRSEDLVLQIDADHIEQALINLVRNAADAALSPDAVGGDAARVEISWQTAGTEVVIAVLDNGPGLSNAGNLFVPFYTTKPGGTGIGLVLAQQIAQAHRGSVQLANRTDGRAGCRADLRLPLQG
ncbi:MAG TPA: ATP-binding protein [Edaphobacter sp.]|jgi:nitrogen fixation/metabolism regulation signal transduction histidine kinase|nr:ATP-binding protein [Edaphobacter sp.]